MPLTRPTYELAANQIGQYVQPLTPGALAMPFDIRDEEGRPLKSTDDHLAGKFLVLVFLNNPEDQQAIPLLTALEKSHDSLDKLNATLIALNASSNAVNNKRLKKQSGFAWPLCGDSTGAVFASYGLHKGNCANVRIVVLTPFRQVRGWVDDPDNIDETIGAIMDILNANQDAEAAQWNPPHAPVLIIPNVLSRAECKQIIETYHTGGPFTVRPPRPGEFDGNYKIPVYEHDRQDRVDHIIKDKEMLAFLDSRIFERITPMIQKSFAFNVTQREDLHIARYVGERGGFPMGHRDNTSPATAYRRFALSMNLNDDYEGGGVAFKEFGARAYKSPAGSAIVFSSSLLHEVLETTKGIRYTLISHLFDVQNNPAR
jgi:peroxiredoxin